MPPLDKSFPVSNLSIIVLYAQLKRLKKISFVQIEWWFCFKYQVANFDDVPFKNDDFFHQDLFRLNDDSIYQVANFDDVAATFVFQHPACLLKGHTPAKQENQSGGYSFNEIFLQYQLLKEHTQMARP